MSRELLIGMLRKGQTGDDILQILDVIVSSDNLFEDAEDEMEEWLRSYNSITIPYHYFVLYYTTDNTSWYNIILR